MIIPAPSTPSRFELLSGIYRDGGPIYAETSFGGLIVEPLNAMSAGLFLALAFYWGIRLAPDFRRQHFVFACLTLIGLGGAGGSLYHAFRSSKILYALDVAPVALLFLAVSLFFWRKVIRSWILILLIWSPVFFLQRWVMHQFSFTLFYAGIATLLLSPVVLYLYRTHYRYIDRVLYAVLLFAIGVFFRSADAYAQPYLSTGTHWIWHVFSVAAAYFMIDYLRRCAVHPPAFRVRRKS